MITNLDIYKVVTKYPSMLPDGSVSGCQVIIRTDECWEFPILLPIEFNDKTHSEIINECDKIIYQKLFPQRAEEEKFKELTDQIELSKSQQVKMEAMMKLMSATLNEIIATLPGEVIDEPTTTI